MNNFNRELGFEQKVRECIIKDGTYTGWLAKIIESDFPEYKVEGYNVIKYKTDKFGNPTPFGQAQLDGIDIVIYIRNEKNPNDMSHIYIQEKATRKKCNMTGKYGFNMEFEIVNKNRKQGWACDLNRVHYLIYYYKDCTVIINGLGEICKICNNLYNVWKENGGKYQDNMSFTIDPLRNQKMKVNKSDGSEEKYWSITTFFSEKYVLNSRVYNIRKEKYHYRIDEE